MCPDTSIDVWVYICMIISFFNHLLATYWLKRKPSNSKVNLAQFKYHSIKSPYLLCNPPKK